MVDRPLKHQLLLVADEIYDKISTTSASMATAIAPDMLCLTFNGNNRRPTASRIPGGGWRCGPKDTPAASSRASALLANMRICAQMSRRQHAIQEFALGGHQGIEDLVLPGGRLLEQRDIAWLTNEIPGVCASNRRRRAVCVCRTPGLDIDDATTAFVPICCCRKTSRGGAGSNWPAPDHLRLVTLPCPRSGVRAIRRLGSFLISYRQLAADAHVMPLGWRRGRRRPSRRGGVEGTASPRRIKPETPKQLEATSTNRP